jgi:hypothetical protein
MTPYKDLSGRSGIEAYEIRERSIVIRFKHAGSYIYNYDNPGAEEVEHMKRLALSGKDLSTYISQTVTRRYAKKL